MSEAAMKVLGTYRHSEDRVMFSRGGIEGNGTLSETTQDYAFLLHTGIHGLLWLILNFNLRLVHTGSSRQESELEP